MRRALLMAGWLLVAATGFVQNSVAQDRVYGYDVHGRPIRRLAATGTQAVVLFFLASDCPISNRYAPEIRRLEKELSARKIAVWLVYPNATETAAGVVQHEAAFNLDGPTLVRPSASLMAEARATITPEAALMVSEDAGWRSVYSGRIDDQYVDIGRERPKATHHDLEDAVEAVLAHKPVAMPGGPAVGCGIVSQAALGKP